MKTPRGFLGTLAVSLLLASGLCSAQSFNGGMTGTWWNPARAGEGQFLSFERIGDRHVAVIAYFTYDADGRAHWLVGNADYSPGAQTLDIPVVSGRGARFGVGFRTQDVNISLSGTVTLEILACDRMRLGFVDAAQAFEVEITRLVGPLEGVACDGSASAGDATHLVGSVSGGWWDPARSGEGNFIAFERLGERRVASVFYFTYDEAGNPRWLVGNADYEAGADRIEVPLVTGAGARFGQAFDAADVQIAPEGRALIEQDGCGNTWLRYTGKVTFGLQLERLVGALDGVPCSLPATPPSFLDNELRPLIAALGLTGDPSRGRELPGIDAPLAQLGKLLFFSKTLSAENEAACASCHHPALGGGDGLALPVGTAAVNPDLLGPGRRTDNGSILVGRNSNTIFNTALYDSGLFWDSRVESLTKAPGENGAVGGIRTPDSAFGTADSNAGPNLLAAQARFPVLAPGEMLGTGFPGMSNSQVRAHLAARIGNYGSGAGSLPPSQWLARFREAFNSDADAETLITFDNIALALAEYQRSAVFVESPWARYVRGNNKAIPEGVKAGALIFFRPVNDRGAQCVQCHSGDFFTDEKHHVVGFPQVGPGLGDPNADDHGRARESRADRDRHAFRTPSLLNVGLTAPYGHAGAYANLETVFNHYAIPHDTVLDWLDARRWCFLPPLTTDPGCQASAGRVETNSLAALARMDSIRASDPANGLPVVDLAAVPIQTIPSVVAFLRSLTDPCLLDRSCFGRWIPSPAEAPDGFQLNAVDAQGRPL
jgi:cytochrome c peroxidase